MAGRAAGPVSAGSRRRLRRTAHGGGLLGAGRRLGAAHVARDGEHLGGADRAAGHAPGLSAGAWARPRLARVDGAGGAAARASAVDERAAAALRGRPLHHRRAAVRRVAHRNRHGDRAGTDVRGGSVPGDRGPGRVCERRPGARGRGGHARARPVRSLPAGGRAGGVAGDRRRDAAGLASRLRRVRGHGDPGLPPLLASGVHLRAVRLHRPAGHDAADRGRSGGGACDPAVGRGADPTSSWKAPSGTPTGAGDGPARGARLLVGEGPRGLLARALTRRRESPPGAARSLRRRQDADAAVARGIGRARSRRPCPGRLAGASHGCRPSAGGSATCPSSPRFSPGARSGAR